MTKIHALMTDNILCDGKCASNECVCGNPGLHRLVTNVIRGFADVADILRQNENTIDNFHTFIKETKCQAKNTSG